MTMNDSSQFYIEIENDEIQEDNVRKRIISKTKLYLDWWLQKDVQKANRNFVDVFDHTIFIFLRSMIDYIIYKITSWRNKRKIKRIILAYKKKNGKRSQQTSFDTKFKMMKNRERKSSECWRKRTRTPTFTMLKWHTDRSNLQSSIAKRKNSKW